MRVAVMAAMVMVGMGQFVHGADAPAAPAAPAQPPASQPAKKTPIDFRKLKEMMPAELGGIKRSNNEGEKMTLGDFVISHARGEFQKPEPAENDPQIYVEIFDYIGAKDMAAVMTAWQSMEVDKESDTGYERTTKVKEQPAFETYQNEGKSGQIQIWVASRFYINVQTTNLTAEQVKKLAESLPIEKLVEASKS
jgi:hypothetical protein